MEKLLTIVALITLSGCATSGIDRSEQGKMVKEFYAAVNSEKQVELSSNVKTGIATGSAVGVLDNIDGNHEDMIAGGIAGALVWGLLTAVFEGDNTAYEYSLISNNGGDFAVVQKERLPVGTNCVKVRTGNTVILEVTSQNNCED